jgi:hypothetical protein
VCQGHKHSADVTPRLGVSSGVAAFEREVAHRWAPWSNDGGMTYEQGMNVAKARK